MANFIGLKFDTSGFQQRSSKLIKMIDQELNKALEDIQYQLTEDLLALRFMAGRARGAGYGMLRTGNFRNGILNSAFIDKKNKIVGFLKSKMDAATDNSGLGYGYWRLYEYGGKTERDPNPNKRVGASKDSHFVPNKGKGRSGEGLMIKGGTSKGVYPTRLFRNTLKGREKFIQERFQEAIHNALEKIK